MVRGRTLDMQHESTMQSTRMPKQTTMANNWNSSGMYDFGGPVSGSDGMKELVGTGVRVGDHDMVGSKVGVAMVRRTCANTTLIWLRCGHERARRTGKGIIFARSTRRR